jgi:hypothetical protein
MPNTVGNGGNSHDKQPASTPQTSQTSQTKKKRKSKQPQETPQSSNEQPPLHFESNPPKLEILVQLTTEGMKQTPTYDDVFYNRCWISDIDVQAGTVSVMYENKFQSIVDMENIPLQYLSYPAALPAVDIDVDVSARVREAIQKRQKDKETRQKQANDDLEKAKLEAQKAANKLAAEVKKLAVEQKKFDKTLLKHQEVKEKRDFGLKETQYNSQIKQLEKDKLNADKAYKDLEKKYAAYEARILELERELAELSISVRVT